MLGISGNLRMEQKRRKTKQPGLRPEEMHPFWCWRTTSPEGEVLAALCLVMLMRSLLLCGFILPPA